MKHIDRLAVEALEPRLTPASGGVLFGLATAALHADPNVEIPEARTTTTTDEDGYYLVRYQHTGAPANCTV